MMSTTKTKLALINQPAWLFDMYQPSYESFDVCLQHGVHQRLDKELILQCQPDVTIFFSAHDLQAFDVQALPGKKILWLSVALPFFVNKYLLFDQHTVENLADLVAINTQGFDGVIHADPLCRGFLNSIGVKLNDYHRYFVPTESITGLTSPARPTRDVFYYGPSNKNTEQPLGYLKHYGDVLHVANGLYGKPLYEALLQAQACLSLNQRDLLSVDPFLHCMLATGRPCFTNTCLNEELHIYNHDFVLQQPNHMQRSLTNLDQFNDLINGLGNDNDLPAYIDYYYGERHFDNFVQSIVDGGLVKPSLQPSVDILTKMRYAAKDKDFGHLIDYLRAAV